MDLSAIEDDLVSKLTTDIPTIKTIGFPNDVSEFIDKHPKGGILVRYDGSTYIEPEPNSQKKVLQDRTSTWTFSIISKSLKPLWPSALLSEAKSRVHVGMAKFLVFKTSSLVIPC